ncbi:MAG: Ku protein [Phycisphaeraceae bacterium]
MARSIWKGNISFGMVNIPVTLHTAVRDQAVHFHMLSEDGTCRLRRKLYCPETGEEYDFNKAARGYELAPGQYVLIRNEELERLEPEKGRNIEISQFVDAGEIDPVYYERPYYLLPEASSLKGYRLLIEAMRDREKVGLATFVMRSKQYLAAIRAGDRDVLMLETMHYDQEVVRVGEGEEIQPPEAVEPSEQERRVAQQLVDALTQPFEPARFEDTYTRRLQELIEAKAEGREDVVLQESSEPEAPQVINLMEALERSLEQAGGQQGKGKRKSGRRRKSA